MRADDSGKSRRRRRTDPGAAREELQRRFHLTETEAAVAECLLQGTTYESGARQLGISINTLHTHVKAIHRKAGVSTSLEFVARFYAPD